MVQMSCITTNLNVPNATVHDVRPVLAKISFKRKLKRFIWIVSLAIITFIFIEVV